MNIRIRYFAAAVEAAGCEEEELSIAADATLGSLKSVLEKRYGPDMQEVLNSGSFLIDQVVRRDPDYPLSDQVDVLPPFAGV